MSTTTGLRLPESTDSFSGSSFDFCKIKPVAHLTRLNACGLLTVPHWCSDDLFCTRGFDTCTALHCVGCPSVHSSIWSSFNRVTNTMFTLPLCPPLSQSQPRPLSHDFGQLLQRAFWVSGPWSGPASTLHVGSSDGEATAHKQNIIKAQNSKTGKLF